MIASVAATLNCKLTVTADDVFTVAVSSLIEFVPPLLSWPTRGDVLRAGRARIIHDEVGEVLELIGRAGRGRRRGGRPAKRQRVGDGRGAGRVLGQQR